MRHAVELWAVGKRYGVRRPWVLRDVSLAVDGGTIVEVAGANGAGKSTLLRILAGATLPSAGRRSIATGCSLGYMPERLSAPGLCAAAYLRHHVRLRGLDPHEGQAQIPELANLLDAGALLEERMTALSKGSLQKIAAIQALLGPPKVLVLDEPFASLDARARETLSTVLARRAHEDGAAIVFCDHREQFGPHTDRRLTLRSAQLLEESASSTAGVPRTRENRRELVVDREQSDAEIARLIDEGWHIVVVRERPAGEVAILAVTRSPAA